MNDIAGKFFRVLFNTAVNCRHGRIILNGKLERITSDIFYGIFLRSNRSTEERHEISHEYNRSLSRFLTGVSKTALGPTEPPIQWVLGALSLGIKRPGREADHSPASNAEVKECVE
jgi:hypothetical protein